jgi:hypothetical protein
MNEPRARGDLEPALKRLAGQDGLLRESVRGAGLEGTPLQLQSLAFQPNLAAIVSGMMGPPAWSLRLKAIHDRRTALAARLDAAWSDLAHRYRTRPRDFARRWRAYLDGLDLAPLNELIAKHNAYYPIEARLPIVYPHGHYHVPPGVEYPQDLITVERLLDYYPDDLDIALYFSAKQAEARAGGSR